MVSSIVLSSSGPLLAHGCLCVNQKKAPMPQNTLLPYVRNCANILVFFEQDTLPHLQERSPYQTSNLCRSWCESHPGDLVVPLCKAQQQGSLFTVSHLHVQAQPKCSLEPYGNCNCSLKVHAWNSSCQIHTYCHRQSPLRSPEKMRWNPGDEV